MHTQSSKSCILYSQALKEERSREDGIKITWATIAEAHGCSETQAGRILGGAFDDQVSEHRFVLSGPLGRILAPVVTCGTPYRFVLRDAAQDVNHNGRIDKGDAQLGLTDALSLVAEKLKRLQECGEGRSYTSNEVAELHSLGARIIEQVGAVVDTVDRLSMTGPRMAGGAA